MIRKPQWFLIVARTPATIAKFQCAIDWIWQVALEFIAIARH